MIVILPYAQKNRLLSRLDKTIDLDKTERTAGGAVYYF